VKRLTAGSEIDAWCTKCRMNLAHRIVALVDGRPKRVVCMTCGSEHNYREPKDETRGQARGSRARTSKGTRTRVTAAAAQEAQRRQEWQTRVTNEPSESFRPYSTADTFALGELVLHRKFGAGYVSEVLPEGKLSVMFESGPKTLIHGAK
jgi:hypothetical protein